MTSNGLLLLDKPQGATSHDAVDQVRRVLNERRVGHAGTLDPMATGLLVMAVGASTRLLRFAQSETKRYEGVVTFGVRTDSLDADGDVLERRDVPALDVAVVNGRATSMLGSQQQTPPMVSAIKVNGRRLHALAREGIEVEREPRTVRIDAFELAPLEGDTWSFAVTCSTGTYVRVLLSDMAERLGTIGHLSALRRVASGHHVVSDALTYFDFEDRVSLGASVLAPPRAFVEHLTSVTISDDEERRFRQGQRVSLDAPGDGEIAALNAAGALVAVVRRRGEHFQPVVVLPDDVASAHE
ncbi:MAG TPA: tRNA pseudouridine(55) synthase TruB [Acidimicrobiales bacterium]|jgi:tRNA pseudouridine55 synthase|nr:tRNA pseudouridine(55) synthase TruB [Acidimicrobiales bacterium]